MNFFINAYRKLAKRIYAVGKLEFEQQQAKWLFEKGTISPDTKFHPGAEINNLANDKSKIIIGSNSHISGLLLVYSYGGQIKIGDNCSLSPYSRIVSCKNIMIGNRVLIAHNVNIIDNISHPIDARLRHEDYLNSYTIGMQQYDIRGTEIIIEDDVWIGFNSTILKGVKIGTGAIIGAGSMVTKDVEAWTVNIGNPLKCIKKLVPVEVSNLNT